MLEKKKRLFSYSLISVLAIYVLIITGFGSSYTKNFLSFGDGIQYASIAKEIFGLNDENLIKYLEQNTLIRADAVTVVSLNDYLRKHEFFSYVLKNIKDLNLGFMPGFLAGYFFPANEKFINYYLGQIAIYFFALLISYLYLRKHEPIDKAALRNVFIASLLAPYMLVIGAYPTKYLMIYVALFLSINLLYVATVTKSHRDVLIFFCSLFILLLMKFQLALLLAALSIVVLWLRMQKTIFAILLLLGTITLGIGFLIFEMDYFVKLYAVQSNDGVGRKFEILYDNIALKIIIKSLVSQRFSEERELLRLKF